VGNQRLAWRQSTAPGEPFYHRCGRVWADKFLMEQFVLLTAVRLREQNSAKQSSFFLFTFFFRLSLSDISGLRLNIFIAEGDMAFSLPTNYAKDSVAAQTRSSPAARACSRRLMGMMEWGDPG